MFNGPYETHIPCPARERRARAGAAGGRAGDAHGNRRDRRHDSRHRAQLPRQPCLAVSRTTGFQVKVATANNLVSAPRAGTVVAWTITLGNPNAAQIKFFEANEGGPSEAGIAILAPQNKPNLTYKLVAQSPLVKLQPYFGKTAQFPLETTIPVKKGYVVALTVPSWAPALALGFGRRHLVARQPPQGRLQEHQLSDHPDRHRQRRPVLLPLPDRPPHLQRDADLDSVAAELLQMP